MKVHETRSHSLAGGEEHKMDRRKHKTDSTNDTAEHAAKKTKSESRNGKDNSENFAAAFKRFCKEMSEHLSIEQMRQLLEVNDDKWSGADDAVVQRCMDMVYYAPLDGCPICGGNLECGSIKYYCSGAYSEWSTCSFSTRQPPKKEALVLLDSIEESPLYNLLKEHQDPESRTKREAFGPEDKPFVGMTISLFGRLSQTHQRWKSDIEEHGGTVANSVMGVTCLVVSASEPERGSSSKVAETMENGIPLVSEDW